MREYQFTNKNLINSLFYINKFKDFKEQLKGKENGINIALTFSFGSENEDESVKPEILEMMFKDYASFTGIEFVSEDIKKGEEAYFEDIVARGTQGGSGRNSKNIDLIIVADQLLTGYDSKKQLILQKYGVQMAQYQPSPWNSMSHLKKYHPLHR